MRTPLFYATAALIAFAAPSGVRAQSMLDQIVIQKCATAMQADNIEAAKTICTQQAQAGI